MIVTIVDRGRDGWALRLVTVRIGDKCPKCGGDRGKAVSRRFCDDGEFYNVDTWDNPCGHTDRYGDVLKEAEELK